MNTDSYPNATPTRAGWLRRTALALGAVGGLVAGVVAPASAAHARTEPITERIMISDTESNSVSPCDGSLGDLTIEGEQLIHLVDTGRTFQFTGVLKGSFEFDPYDPAVPTAAGPLILVARDTVNYGQLKDLRVSDVVIARNTAGGPGQAVLFRVTYLYSADGGSVVKFDSVRCINWDE